jgi:hypothetical protein
MVRLPQILQPHKRRLIPVAEGAVDGDPVGTVEAQDQESPNVQLLRHRRTWRLNRCDNRNRLIDQGFNDDSRQSGPLHVQDVGSTRPEVDDASRGDGPRSLILTMTERLLSRPSPSRKRPAVASDAPRRSSSAFSIRSKREGRGCEFESRRCAKITNVTKNLDDPPLRENRPDSADCRRNSGII